MPVYKSLGFFFVGLAALGVFVPLLPTTPFLLVAAACFARSSERWHRWLLANRTFGPLLHTWHTRRCISRRTKVVAVTSVLAFGGCSVAFAVEGTTLRLIGLALVATGLACVLRLRTCADDGQPGPPAYGSGDVAGASTHGRAKSLPGDRAP